jgi:exodeoxyribonuclease VII small subunit
MAKEKKNFEQSLAQLEEIVTTLEQGDIALDESLKIFEEGVKLFKFCQKELDQANSKINILSQNLTTVSESIE